MFDDRYLEFLELFNERQFYESHEALEDLWLDCEGRGRTFYQGLIHMAAAFLHLSRKKMPPCQARLTSALRYLEEYPPSYEGLDVESIRASLGYWLTLVVARGPDEIVIYDDALVPLLHLDGRPG